MAYYQSKEEIVQKIIREFSCEDLNEDNEYIEQMEKYCEKLVQKLKKQKQEIRKLREENEMLRSMKESVCDDCKQDCIFERKC